jgi:hypothetical protein
MVQPYLDGPVSVPLKAEKFNSYNVLTMSIMKAKMNLMDDYFAYWHNNEYEYVEMSEHSIQ